MDIEKVEFIEYKLSQIEETLRHYRRQSEEEGLEISSLRRSMDYLRSFIEEVIESMEKEKRRIEELEESKEKEE